jgi:hypothetical protein
LENIEIKIKPIVKIDGSRMVFKLLYLEPDKLLVLNYLAFHDVHKTALLNLETGQISYIVDGLTILEFSKYKLYSIKNAYFTNPKLHIYDIKNNTELKTIPITLFYGYGNSCIVEDKINKLYIAFHPEGKDGEGLLIVDLNEDKIIKQMDLKGWPTILSPTQEKDKLLVKVIGYDHKKRILIIDTMNDEILESFDCDYFIGRSLLDGSRLLSIELKKGIHFFDINQKKIIETKYIPEIFDIAPTMKKGIFLLLLQRAAPFYMVDRLVLYDIESNTIFAEKKISFGMHLKTFRSGRIFFTEMIDNTLVLNEVEILEHL